MTNPANSGTITGRLAQDIKSFMNDDGSKKLLISIAVDDNFVSGTDRKAQTNFIQLESFVPANRNAGGWDRVRRGDLVSLQFHVDAKPYTDGQGQTHYPQKLVVDGFPTFLEPKSVTDRRAAENAAKAAQAQPVGEVSAEQRIAELEAQLAAERGATVAEAPMDYEDTTPFGN